MKRLGYIVALAAAIVGGWPVILWAASTFTGTVVVPNGSTLTLNGNQFVKTSGIQFQLYGSTQVMAVTTTPPQLVIDNAYLVNVGSNFNSPALSELRVFCKTAAVGATANQVDLYRGPSGASFAKIGSTLSWTTAIVASVTFSPVALAADDVLQVQITQVDGTPPTGCTVLAGGTQIP